MCIYPELKSTIAIASVKKWRLRNTERMVIVETEDGSLKLPIDIAHHLHLDYWRI
jgi:hypothetical protein